MALKGIVGIVASDTARFSLFSAALCNLRLPPRTEIRWVLGHRPQTLNVLARWALEEGCEWLWTMDDDHVFEPDMLLQMLGHDKDLVGPLVLQRSPPFQPIAYTDFSDDGEFDRKRIRLSDHPEGGMVRIHSSGRVGMLIRRHVLEGLADPWFEGGKLTPELPTEDIYFTDKAREAGFEVWVDLDAPLGHLTTGTIWPTRTPDRDWTFSVDLNGSFPVQFAPGTQDAIEAGQ